MLFACLKGVVTRLRMKRGRRPDTPVGRAFAPVMLGPEEQRAVGMARALPEVRSLAVGREEGRAP